MTTIDAALTGVLNELLAVQHDRMEAYVLAGRETTDTELRTLFDELAARSHRFSNELSDEVLHLDGIPTTASTTEGRALRTRMDLSAATSLNDRRAILSACAAGESAALRVYREALDSDTELPVREMIEAQFISLRHDHERIRKLRETTPAAKAVVEPSRQRQPFKLTL